MENNNNNDFTKKIPQKHSNYIYDDGAVLFCKQTADILSGDGAKSSTIFTTHLEFNYWSQKNIDDAF